MPTLAVRNNNPGNLKDPTTGAFRQFPSSSEGYNALVKDLTAKMTGATSTKLKPTSSLKEFSSVYAPASDKNDPEQYAQNLSRQLGVSVDTPIGSLQGRVHDFAKAIATNEDPSGAKTATLSRATPQNESVSGAGNVQTNQSRQLSHEQLIANINAMEKQGAKPEEVQGYLDSLKPKSNSGFNPQPYSHPDSSPGQVDFSGAPETPPQSPGILSSIGNAIGSAAKSVVSPVATMIARPFQAGAELLGADSGAVDKFSKDISGGLIAPVPQNAGDVVKDVGRGAQTVALGLAPVAGGALFGAGNSVEQGNSLLSGQTVLQAGLGAVGGKVADVATPYIAKGLSAVTPKIAKDAMGAIGDSLSPLTKGIGDFADKTKILPDSLSKAINKGAETVNKTPGVIGNALKNQYGFGEGSTPADATAMVSKALGNTGQKSAGVFANTDKSRLKGLETLFDDAPTVKVTNIDGESIPYSPTTATLPQHVEALANLKKDIYGQLEKNLSSATKEGVQVDTGDVESHLQSIVNSTRTGVARTRAQTLLDEISKLNTPSEVDAYLQDLNAGLKGVSSGTSDNISRHIDYEATQKLNDALDKTIINIKDNSSSIRILKNKYSSLKTVENGLVSKAQQLARKPQGMLGGGLYDYLNAYNLADFFTSIANPVKGVKDLATMGLLKMAKGAKEPEAILQNIFKTISNYRGVAPVVESAVASPLKNVVTGGLLKTAFPQTNQ